MNVKFSELPAVSGDLREKLMALSHCFSDDAERIRFTNLLVQNYESKFTIVVTGPYATGKTTLINALTDGRTDFETAADWNTSSVTKVDWADGITILDTPGRQGPISEHEEIADDAISSADLVLFTVDLSFFNDSYRDEVLRIINTLGKLQDSLFVFTKESLGDISNAIIEHELEKTTGYTNLPYVRVDSLEHLEHVSDEFNYANQTRDCGIDLLKSKMENLSIQRGSITKLLVPFQAIHLASQIGKASCVKDVHDQKLLVILTKDRDSLEFAIEALRTALQVFCAKIEVRYQIKASETVERVTDLIAHESDKVAISAVVDEYLDSEPEFLKLISTQMIDEMTEIFRQLELDINEVLNLPHMRGIEEYAIKSEDLNLDGLPLESSFSLKNFLEKTVEQSKKANEFSWTVDGEPIPVVDILLEKATFIPNAVKSSEKIAEHISNAEKTLKYIGPLIDIFSDIYNEKQLTKRTNQWADNFLSLVENRVTLISKILEEWTTNIIDLYLSRALEIAETNLASLESKLSSLDTNFAKFTEIEKESKKVLQTYGHRVSVDQTIATN